jgi:hypothetical protein
VHCRRCGEGIVETPGSVCDFQEIISVRRYWAPHYAGLNTCLEFFKSHDLLELVLNKAIFHSVKLSVKLVHIVKTSVKLVRIDEDPASFGNNLPKLRAPSKTIARASRGRMPRQYKLRVLSSREGLSPARVHNCVFRLFYTCCTAAQHRDCGDPLGGHRTAEFREIKIRWSPSGPQSNIIGFTAGNTVGLVVEYSPATGETRVRFPDGVCALSKSPLSW